jgi:hypothetical protein
VALRRLKAAASAVNEDVHGWGSNPFLQGAPGNAASLTPTASGIARVVKGYKELASVADDIGGD